MKKLITYLSIAIIFVISCEKEKTDEKYDWTVSKNKFLLLDSSIVEYNTMARLYPVEDSIVFFYGFNPWANKYCFYKIILNNEQINIQDLKTTALDNPMGFKDFSFPNRKTGYLLLRDKQSQEEIDSKLLKTMNGGESWSELPINHKNSFRWIHFISPDSGIAINELSEGSKYEMLSTNDGGNNWQNQNDFLTTNLRDFYFIPQNPRICFILSAGNLFYSTDGGFNWQFHSKPNFGISSMSFLDENVGFLTDQQSVYKISKIGGSYLKIYTNEHTFLTIRKIEALNQSDIYFCDYQLFFNTTNAFNTVSQMSIQDPMPDVLGDRLPVDFTMFAQKNILVDIKGTLYINKNK